LAGKTGIGIDSRAIIAFTLVIVTGIIAIYGMYLKWTTTDLLSVLAFFGPLITAVITYYFGQKNEEKRAAIEKGLTVTP
jgi:ABC-type Fe3+-siderophore transport system permease subunit